MEVSEFSRLLKRNNRDSEVWIDSSPTGYSSCKRRWLLEGGKWGGALESSLSDDFLRVREGFTGATTNPRLITRAVLESPECWQDWIATLPPDLCTTEITRRVHERMITQGAAQLYRLWVRSKGRYGWLSAQVDCAQRAGVRELVERGIQLARLAPNVMIKVPGSASGYLAIEQLVAKGYSVNNTFCFTVSQCAAGLRAIHNGRAQALRDGVDIDGARYVISFMIGRLGDEPEFSQQAREQRLFLSVNERRWAELAVYQAMQALLHRHSTPVRLLLCSLKIDTDQAGREQCWHLERTGSDTTLYTLTPEIVEFIQRRHQMGRPVCPAQYWRGVPKQLMSKLLQIEYFTQAYFLDAQPPARFEQHPAFVTARNNALVAQQQLRGFVDMVSPQQPPLWGVRPAPEASRAPS